ncbi:hypothetical protein JCM3766R1_005464 [Sporobolomyces carnicolor]
MSNNEEQTFTTQPIEHNNGAINEPGSKGFPGSNAEKTPGLGSAPNLAHLHEANALGGRGDQPHVMSDEIAQGLEKPKTKEELQSLAAKLNN